MCVAHGLSMILAIAHNLQSHPLHCASCSLHSSHTGLLPSLEHAKVVSARKYPLLSP